MAKRRHLTRAPITEAVIDLRLQSETPLGSILERPELAGLGYKTVDPITAFQTRIDLEKGRSLPPDTRSEQVGTQYRSGDGQQVVQFRKNGFSFHRLEPYTSWETVFPDAWKLWEIYCAGLPKNLIVGRAAVRFVNRLRLPTPVPNLAEFLVAPPVVPKALPQALRGFLTRVTINEPKKNLSALITQALEPQALDLSHLIVLLDIDAFREGMFELSDVGIESTLWALRDFKNQIFFESITETTAGLFE